MPLNADQWRAVIGTAQNDLERAMRLLNSWELKKVTALGLDPSDTKYQSDMPTATRSQIRIDAIAVIDAIIASLTAARNTP